VDGINNYFSLIVSQVHHPMLVAEFINSINDCLGVIGWSAVDNMLLELMGDFIPKVFGVSLPIQLCSLVLIAFLV